MNNILIYRQDDKFTSFCSSIAIGRRQSNGLIGDKLNELLKSKEMAKEELIKQLGNSYSDTINRILNNQEIPKPKMIEKLVNFFELDSDYFEEKELENVIITDSGIVVAKYDTNDRAFEVKKQFDEYIKECYMAGKPIILNMPKE